MALAGRAKLLSYRRLEHFRNRMHYLRNDQKLPMQKPILSQLHGLAFDSRLQVDGKDISWDSKGLGWRPYSRLDGSCNHIFSIGF